jgi:hypothetical protein
MVEAGVEAVAEKQQGYQSLIDEELNVLQFAEFLAFSI